MGPPQEENRRREVLEMAGRFFFDDADGDGCGEGSSGPMDGVGMSGDGYGC